jgi:hypothetical protein
VLNLGNLRSTTRFWLLSYSNTSVPRINVMLRSTKVDPERGEIARSWGSVSLTRFDTDRSAKVNVDANKLFSSSSSSRGGRYPSSSLGGGGEGRTEGHIQNALLDQPGHILPFLEATTQAPSKAARAADCRARAYEAKRARYQPQGDNIPPKVDPHAPNPAPRPETRSFVLPSFILGTNAT